MSKLPSNVMTEQRPRRYKTLPEATVRALLEEVMGFHQVHARGFNELVWERAAGNSGYAVRVYSSVFNGVTKESGTTTIRVCLVDVITQQMIAPPLRVYRSSSALSIMRQRVGELWRWAEANRKPRGGFSRVQTYTTSVNERFDRHSHPSHPAQHPGANAPQHVPSPA
jgi:hypothetical protein